MQARAENSSMRSVLSIVKRAVNDKTMETADDMNSLSIDSATRLLCLEALHRSCGNRNLASKMVGVTRSTFFLYMKKYNIRVPSTRKQKPVEIEYVQME